MRQKHVLDLESAKRVAAAAEQEAEKNGWNVAIAIVDDGGHLVYLQRDNVQLGSIDVAINKAKAALIFRRPTRFWQDMISGERPEYLAMPGMLPVEGGLPLFYGNEVVGGIGVSGVKSNEDGIIARAGVDAL
jgi:glc operon protein GlcG